MKKFLFKRGWTPEKIKELEDARREQGYPSLFGEKK